MRNRRRLSGPPLGGRPARHGVSLTVGIILAMGTMVPPVSAHVSLMAPL